MLPQVLKIEVDKMRFQLSPLPLLKVLRLDKKVLALVLPALSGFTDLDAQIDFGLLSKGISEALTRMPDNDFESLALDLLSSVAYLPDNGAPVEMTSAQELNTIFSGKILTIYKLLFEVMRFNKFSPFALLEGGGNLTGLISGLLKPENTRNGSGLGLTE